MLDRIARQILTDTLTACSESGLLPLEEIPEVTVERPKREEHGDFATNVCLSLARPLKRNPRVIAQTVVDNLVDPDGLLASSNVAGPGFINLRFRHEVWFARLAEVHAAGTDFGRSDVGAGRKVLVEFVSANPTGPLHVGHGRGAVVGDVLARLLSCAGFDVAREYYINDVGQQMWHLGNSLYHRYRELHGFDEPYPPKCYQGAYIKDIAKDFDAEVGDSLKDADYENDEETAERFRAFIREQILDDIREDLGEFGITFDEWFRESSLYDNKKVYGLIDGLEKAGHIYTDEATGAKKFRTSGFGDDDDRVVIRSDGRPTYFASDIAYHQDKFDRGFETLIDIWGADHHGYIPRMRAGLTGTGHDPDDLEVLLVQFVNLVRGGEAVAMSTRSGTFVDLRTVREEVGRDAARFFFVMRRADSQLDFDLDLAKKASLDNPVYYVQYGHARICSILRKADDEGYTVPGYSPELVAALRLPEELELTRRILAYPALIETCALHREPHHIVFYLQELIRTFHSYYTRYKHAEKIVSPDTAKRDARLFLVDCLRMVLKGALELLGVSAPERMHAPGGEDDENEAG